MNAHQGGGKLLKRSVVDVSSALQQQPSTPQEDPAITVRPSYDLPFSKIALAQSDPRTGDLEGNRDQIIRATYEAVRLGAQIVVHTELGITGCCAGDSFDYDDFVFENKLRALEAARATPPGVVSIFGFVDYDRTKTNEDGTLRKYNAAMASSAGQVLGIIHKVLLPNYRIFDDKRYFTPGGDVDPVQFEIGGKSVKLGILICEDMWDAAYSRKIVNELNAKGAEIFVSINASPGGPGKLQERDDIIRRHIAATGKPFVYNNTVGVQDIGKNIIPFDGQSRIYDQFGNVIAQANRLKEETLVVDLKERIGKKIEIPTLSRQQEVFETLVSGVRGYAAKCGFDRAILPISGGADSALCAAILAEAFGAQNLAFYNLPSKFNSENTKQSARHVAQALGLDMESQYGVIPIQPAVDVMTGDFEVNAHPIQREVTIENLQAGIRGRYVMMDSNDSGALLVSCGNKTEIALGYCTLYGDMSGGISLVGDVDKRGGEVNIYSLLHYVNERFEKIIIPDFILNTKPSAELTSGQYDPFDYFVISPLVNEFVDHKRSPRQVLELFNTGKLDSTQWTPDEEGRTVYQKHNSGSFAHMAYETFALLQRSVYKRLQGPPIIVVSKSAFGFDRREPIINFWRGGLGQEV